MYKALRTLIIGAKEDIPLGTEIDDKDFKERSLHKLFIEGRDFIHIKDTPTKKKELKDEKNSNVE